MTTTPPFMKGPDGVGLVPVRGNNRLADLHDGARSLHATDRPGARDVPASRLSASGPALGDPGDPLRAPAGVGATPRAAAHFAYVANIVSND